MSGFSQQLLLAANLTTKKDMLLKGLQDADEKLNELLTHNSSPKSILKKTEKSPKKSLSQMEDSQKGDSFVSYSQFKDESMKNSTIKSNRNAEESSDLESLTLKNHSNPVTVPRSSKKSKSELEMPPLKMERKSSKSPKEKVNILKKSDKESSDSDTDLEGQVKNLLNKIMLKQSEGLSRDSKSKSSSKITKTRNRKSSASSNSISDGNEKEDNSLIKKELDILRQQMVGNDTKKQIMSKNSSNTKSRSRNFSQSSANTESDSLRKVNASVSKIKAAVKNKSDLNFKQNSDTKQSLVESKSSTFSKSNPNNISQDSLSSSDSDDNEIGDSLISKQLDFMKQKMLGNKTHENANKTRNREVSHSSVNSEALEEKKPRKRNVSFSSVNSETEKQKKQGKSSVQSKIKEEKKQRKVSQSSTSSNADVTDLTPKKLANSVLEKKLEKSPVSKASYFVSPKQKSDTSKKRLSSSKKQLDLIKNQIDSLMKECAPKSPSGGSTSSDTDSEDNEEKLLILNQLELLKQKLLQNESSKKSKKNKSEKITQTLSHNSGENFLTSNKNDNKIESNQNDSSDSEDLVSPVKKINIKENSFKGDESVSEKENSFIKTANKYFQKSLSESLIKKNNELSNENKRKRSNSSNSSSSDTESNVKVENETRQRKSTIDWENSELIRERNQKRSKVQKESDSSNESDFEKQNAPFLNLKKVENVTDKKLQFSKEKKKVSRSSSESESEMETSRFGNKSNEKHNVKRENTKVKFKEKSKKKSSDSDSESNSRFNKSVHVERMQRKHSSSESDSDSEFENEPSLSVKRKAKEAESKDTVDKNAEHSRKFNAEARKKKMLREKISSDSDSESENENEKSNKKNISLLESIIAEEKESVKRREKEKGFKSESSSSGSEDDSEKEIKTQIPLIVKNKPFDGRNKTPVQKKEETLKKELSGKRGVQVIKNKEDSQEKQRINYSNKVGVRTASSDSDSETEDERRQDKIKVQEKKSDSDSESDRQQRYQKFKMERAGKESNANKGGTKGETSDSSSGDSDSERETKKPKAEKEIKNVSKKSKNVIEEKTNKHQGKGGEFSDSESGPEIGRLKKDNILSHLYGSETSRVKENKNEIDTSESELEPDSYGESKRGRGEKLESKKFKEKNSRTTEKSKKEEERGVKSKYRSRVNDNCEIFANYEIENNLKPLNLSLLDTGGLDSDDEIYLLQTSVNFKIKSLLNKKLSFEEDSMIQDGDETYIWSQGEVWGLGRVALIGGRDEMKIIKPKGKLMIRKCYQRKSETKFLRNAMKSLENDECLTGGGRKNKKKKIDFPNGLKVRHPLFGLDFEKRIAIDEEVAFKLSDSYKRHKKKKKKKWHDE